MPVKNINPFVDISVNLRPQRNPFVDKFKSGIFKGQDCVIKNCDLEFLPGNWRSLSRTETPAENLFVEIGCHYGHVLTQIAESCPNALAIGLEITFKRVLKTAARINAANLPNARVTLANAKAFAKLFKPAELDGVILFFPDPWPKEKQKRHRLIQPEMAKILHQTICLGGFLWFKTDSLEYFNEVCNHLKNANFLLNFNEKPNIFASDYQSSFQNLFLAQGKTFYMLTAIRT